MRRSPAFLLGQRHGQSISRARWHKGRLDLVVGASGAPYAVWIKHLGQLWLDRATNGGRCVSMPVRLGGRGSRLIRRASPLALGLTVAMYPGPGRGREQGSRSGRRHRWHLPAVAAHGSLPILLGCCTLAVNPADVVPLACAENHAGLFARDRARHARGRWWTPL